MSIIVDILILAGVLLAIVAVVQVAAARPVLPGHRHRHRRRLSPLPKDWPTCAASSAPIPWHWSDAC
ncbi:exported protein of unknown function [Cupriavidus taiwanensis]|uniref:hypothetical protein n=1 Tax=Cupriavidus taiwanensis TaxID=164546 RepID=UPI000E1035E2|nr:hypothetical protein [Cupriavidus taiwanensis]SPA42976.1 exported protein of unknown function [Cupriavidus taiwanensis]